MTPSPDTAGEARAIPLSRWLVALITAGLSSDEALAIVSRVQRDQLQDKRIAA